MDTKVCTSCKKEKLITEFSKHPTKKDGLQSFCRECNKKQAREDYRKNRKKRLKTIYRAKLKRIAAHQEKLFELFLNSSCVDCGETDPRVLEFDHVRGRKENGVCALMLEGFSWEKIEQEIRKCEICCRNCHTKRTHESSNSYRYKLYLKHEQKQNDGLDVGDDSGIQLD